VAGKDQAMQVTVKEVFAESCRIKVAPAIPGSEPAGSGTTEDYTRWHTRIYGNVAASGHGESQNEKILGGGDATRSNQQFDFEFPDVSFVTDGNFASGVRAAVEVRVDHRTWQQVPTLNDSEPEDPHYVVRIREDGTLSFVFGDGRRGRRLPSGTNNVRIRHRVGAGLAGNLPPYSLVKEVRPHPLLEGLLQPLATAGGNDMEASDAMRTNAPASVLTIERAVSVSDFTHLAAANSSVWQARAFRLPPGAGRSDRIEVAVVPAGGGNLGPLAGTLKDFLTAHALPGVQVSIIAYQAIILNLALSLSIKTDEFDPDLVAEAVRRAVRAAFALEKSRLGEPLFRSQVLKVVEGVAGVENCRCAINPDGFRDETGAATAPQHVAYGPDGAVRRVSPQARQVIYLNKDLSNLAVTTLAFSL
jgi:predicted phage baseplate assembly protein